MKLKNYIKKLLSYKKSDKHGECDQINHTLNTNDSVKILIFCVEKDNLGRRTKDNIIAQEIYRKLEATLTPGISKIQFMGADKGCVSGAKIAVIVGTSAEHFERIIKENVEQLVGKELLPVYAEMSGSDLPKSINRIQAQNYNKIGYHIDLKNAILKMLGCEKEENNKNDGLKLKMFILSIILAILTLTIIFIMTYNIMSDNEAYNDKIYEYAEKLTNEGKYAEAIHEYQKISDYKDSHNLQFNSYSKYTGYYKNKESNADLYLYISDNKTATIELSKIVDEKNVRISETAKIDDCALTANCVDGQKNQCMVNLELNNNGIVVHTEMGNIMSYPVIGDNNIFFDIVNKTDRPIITIDNNKILEWIKNKKSINDIIFEGYEIENEYYHPRRYNGLYTSCNIKNSNIELYWRKSGYGSEDTKIIDHNNPIFFIKAPAGVLIPEKIGDKTIPFVKDDIFYMPGCDYFRGKIGSYDYSEGNITEDTVIGILYKKSFSETEWVEILNRPNSQ